MTDDIDRAQQREQEDRDRAQQREQEDRDRAQQREQEDRDRAQQREQEDRDRAIAAASRELAPGYPGDCDLCGSWSGRLIKGACAPCRDRYRLP